MYLLIGFQVDTDNESKQSHLLKLNKNLNGLKQASLNWFEKLKLKQGLIDCGFKPSAINPCLTRDTPTIKGGVHWPWLLRSLGGSP
jgi:hypothetical protein